MPESQDNPSQVARERALSELKYDARVPGAVVSSGLRSKLDRIAAEEETSLSQLMRFALRHFADHAQEIIAKYKERR